MVLRDRGRLHELTARAGSGPLTGRRAFARRAEYAHLALVGRAAGIAVTPPGRPTTVLAFSVRHGKIVELDVVADPDRVRQLRQTAR